MESLNADEFEELLAGISGAQKWTWEGLGAKIKIISKNPILDR